MGTFVDSERTLRNPAAMSRDRRKILQVLVMAVAIGGLPVAAAHAQCSTPTVPGGGPSATDCILEWGGMPSLVETCTDGDACDADGKADGVCTFALQAFANVAPCAAGPLTVSVKPTSSPVAQALTNGLAAIASGTGCTTVALAVPLKVSLATIKAGKVKLTVSASAGGKPDRDKLKLTCEPSAVAPSFAAVQEIFSTTCATASCHDQAATGGGLDLRAGVAYGNLVGVPAGEAPKLQLVQAGSVKRSYLARKVLGQGLPPAGPQRMPSGRDPLPPGELFTILSWIKNGAPAN